MAIETTTETERPGRATARPPARTVLRRQAYRPPALICHGSLQELTRLNPVAENSDGQFGSTPGT
jgi:hypothetical protein